MEEGVHFSKTSDSPTSCRLASVRWAHELHQASRGGRAGSDASGRTLLAIRQECRSWSGEFRKGGRGQPHRRIDAGRRAWQRGTRARRRTKGASVLGGLVVPVVRTAPMLMVSMVVGLD